MTRVFHSRRQVLRGLAAALPFAACGCSRTDPNSLTVGGLAVTCNLTLPVACMGKSVANKSALPGAARFNYQYAKFNGWPEIKESLRATLKAIQPEFDKTAIETYDQAATLLATQMSEKELTDVAGFFDSPSGKKYIAVTPVFLQGLANITTPWRDKLSTDIVTRARQEMKKKGVDF